MADSEEEDRSSENNSPVEEDEKASSDEEKHSRQTILEFSEDEWNRRLRSARVPRDYIDRLVMDYLVVEGYKDAAAHFEKESGVKSSVDLTTIEGRVQIREAVMAGEIAHAVELVNEMEPQLLDRHEGLFFALRKQQLVEHIAAGRLEEALQFAAQEVAPLVLGKPGFLEELEEVMSLLAFMGCPEQFPGPPLLEPNRRIDPARQLNQAILRSQYQGADPKLPDFIQLLIHCQNNLKRKNPQFSELTGFS
mmetsp:Transcript_33930/g.44761  ORF Transcript_33930/g.44761 Transcript_33930/m.44761 type:complete len:250 (-) Transcript_33930:292-1041(-)